MKLAPFYFISLLKQKISTFTFPLLLQSFIFIVSAVFGDFKEINGQILILAPPRWQEVTLQDHLHLHPNSNDTSECSKI
jgi:hypothetical protein